MRRISETAGRLDANFSILFQEEAPAEIDGEDLPEDMEVLQSTDGGGGDMKFVMVNQQEVFVVKNPSSQQK